MLLLLIMYNQVLPLMLTLNLGLLILVRIDTWKAPLKAFKTNLLVSEYIMSQ